jgi:outer membrane biosynthesis protein TonB
MVKEKQPPKPKPPQKPKVEPPKVEQPKVTAALKVEPPKETTLAASTPPIVAPPAAEVPSFDFDGGKTVESSSDPVQIYKSQVEYALRSKWNRPDNMQDDDYVAEVAISVSPDGQLSDPVWEKGSGNPVWDESVRRALAVVTQMDRPPPTNFPARVTIRFDVQEETEPVLQ